MKKQFLLLLLCSAFVCACVSTPQEEPRPQIPILAWYSIPDGVNATLERYQELADAGFTHSFAHISTMEGAMRALDLCAQVGMKSVFTCSLLKDSTEQTVAKVMNHPGLGAYFLVDEPGNDSFGWLGEWARKIESVDSIHPCYLNLLPNHAACFATVDEYKEHVRLFDEKVNLPQLSYDHYPVNQSGDTIYLNPRFYENLEEISAQARKSGKPFWAFALATAHGPYPIPTIDQLRLQLYANLAYGAQLLQYFTYWNPGTDTWDFHQAPITLEGRRSPVYELVREMNQEIQRRADIFLGCEVESVYHMGNELPMGTTALPALPAHFQKLDTQGKGVLVSTLKNNGHHYVVLQNTSPNHPLELQVETDEQVKICRRDGSREQASKYGPLFVLTVGDVLILEYED